MNPFRLCLVAFLEWLSGNECLICHAPRSRFSAFALCPHCLHALADEFIFFQFQTDTLSVVAVGEYAGMIKELLYWVKFKNSIAAAFVLTECVTRAYAGRLGGFRVQTPSGERAAREGWFVPHGRTLWVPIPCSLLSKEKRGWDPVSLLVEEWKRRYGIEVVRLLQRRHSRGARRQQKQLNRRQRETVSRLRFRLNPKALAALRRSGGGRVETIRVVDDVYTTGATVTAGVALLRSVPGWEGVKMECCVICCD